MRIVNRIQSFQKTVFALVERTSRLDCALDIRPQALRITNSRLFNPRGNSSHAELKYRCGTVRWDTLTTRKYHDVILCRGLSPCSRTNAPNYLWGIMFPLPVLDVVSGLVAPRRLGLRGIAGLTLEALRRRQRTRMLAAQRPLGYWMCQAH
ncbi:Protein of unknown function [Gryllus bimaculatus]|nr:Protein of unknown function [Gryllus bimaculatus]